MEQEQLISKLSSFDNNEIYSALTYIGKNKLQRFQPEVEKFLSSNIAKLRSIAIRVLGFYWKVPVFESVAKEMMYKDPDEETRMVALMSWSEYYRKSNKKQILQELYDILCNTNENSIVREQAYRGILNVSSLQPTDWPKTLVDDIDTDVDWKIVEGILENAQ